MGKKYTVKAGDNLRKIAKEQLGDAEKWEEIYDANKDLINDPNVIQVGMELKIPKDKPKSDLMGKIR
jgi:nucleoid-associated protein YgaU